MATCASLIFNPASGRGRTKEALLPRLTERLTRMGIEVEPAPTRMPGHATELARKALDRRADLVLVWGGDGTLNEVARGLLGSSTPMGVLPGGTANVFARAANIPLELTSACEMLNRSVPREIPAGKADGRPFLLMAGIGLDAEVVRRLNPRFKKRLGALAFWIVGFRLLASYPFSPATVRLYERDSHDAQRYRATSVVAGKVRYYGGSYGVTPRARLEEPLFDVVLFQGRRGIDYLRYLVGVLGGFHLRFKDVLAVKTDRVQVTAPEPLPYHVDGESAGATPVELVIAPRAIRVLLPDRG